MNTKKGFTRQNFSKKNLVGFTLLELLIVIGILAILSTTVILVINPAQLLKKARDSQRISDLNTLKTAIAYYITEAANPDIGLVYTAKTYSDVMNVKCNASTAAATSTAVTTDGLGWIPIDFDTELSGGSPIGGLPTDPNKTAIDADPGRYYVYIVGSITDYTFKLVANLESAHYSSGGPGDVESVDGGVNSVLYEVGTDMTIAFATNADTCFKGGGE